ncbi:uncharacterized protein LOC144138308 [Haemaphysalis longicornis]
MENPSPDGTIIDDIAYMEDALQLQEDGPGGMEWSTGISHNRDCTASNNPDAPECWLFHELPAWNRSLRNISLQLEEVDAPGKLSLVEVNLDFIVAQQELYRRHARLLFYMLVVSHRCVTRVDLTHALFQGGTLDEIRQLPVKALFENSSLRILNVLALPGSGIILRTIWTTLATMIRLQELRLNSCRDVLRLVEPLRTLICNTTALKTLDISELHLGDREWKRLLAALMVNRTVATLSVHTNIMVPRSSSDVAYFSLYLKTATWLASLSVTGFLAEESYDYVKDIVEPVLVTRTLVELTLVDFRLDARCLDMLGRLVARDDILEFLDITNCFTVPIMDIELAPTLSESEAKQKRAEAGHIRSFIRGFQVTRSLKVFAADLGEFSDHDLRALFNALAGVESLKKVIVVGVVSDDLRRYGASIRETGMAGLVALPQTYRLCPAVFTALEDCPGLNGVMVDTRHTSRVYKTFIRRLPTWRHLTSLRLILDDDKLDDATVSTMKRYLSETTALRDLRLLGCNKPDLSYWTVGTDKPHSLLLEALSFCRSLSSLQVKEFFFGEENLRFLAELVRNSSTLCEVHVSPLDEKGRTSFIRFLAPGFARNRTVVSLQDPFCTTTRLEYEITEEHSFVEDVLIRNRSLITCAAEFVVGKVRTDRCAGALEFMGRSYSLVERVVDLACVEESEAEAMISRSMQELDRNQFFTGY